MKLNSEDRNEMTRVLSGEASEKELAHFYQMLQGDPDRKNIFETLKKEWDTASDAMLYKSLNVDEAWARQKNEFLKITSNKKRPSAFIWRWAAVIVIAIGLSFYFTLERFISIDKPHSFTTKAYETMPLELEDGSVITLNQNSTLSYDFKATTRKVSFTGEAYFEIAPDADRPFIIETETAYIKVIGTAVNVKTNESSIDVVVNEGLVEFGPIDRSEKKLLAAGTSGQLLKNKNLLALDGQKPNSISWFTQELVFDHSPLPDVLKDISDTYHIDFRYDGSQLENCHLTADFSKDKLTNVLETIHTIFNVEFTKSDNTYIVTGQACE